MSQLPGTLEAGHTSGRPGRGLFGPAARITDRVRPFWSALLTVAEVTFITLFGWRFVLPFASFDDNVVPRGREFEGNAGWIFVGLDALRDHGELPLWNHYFGTGIPYLADPLGHFFSPLALVPALILGSQDGPRLAVPLTIIAAGLAQYYLGRALGLTPLARVVAALMYMMNGQMIARFEVGHYDFGLAYPYLPLCFAFLYKSMTTERGVLYPLLGGVSLAGLLFAGNLYYFLFFMPGLAVIAAIYAVDVRWRALPAIRWRAIARGAAMAVFGVGFAAIQWVPWYAISGNLSKASDARLGGSPEIIGSLRLLFRGDLAYASSGVDGMAHGFPSEYFSYIGALFIPLFVLSPLALLTRHRRAFIAAVALFWMYVLWGSAAHTPFQYLYENYETLYDFRWTSRQLALAMPSAALIVGLALDAVWRLAREAASRLADAEHRPRAVFAAGAIALASSGAYGLYALDDLYDVNRRHYGFETRHPDAELLTAWLDGDQDRPFLFDQRWNNLGGVRPPFQDLRMVKHQTIWGWALGGKEGVVVETQRPVQLVPPPRYLALPSDFAPPPNATIAAQIGSLTVYRPVDAPPYAGFVLREEAAFRPKAFDVGDRSAAGYRPWPWAAITTADADWPTTNQVRVRGAPAAGQDALIVLESFDQGWRMEVDGERAGKPLNIGGLLAARAQAGEHTYLFVYDPAYARRGVAITLGAIAGTVLLLLYAPTVSLARRRRS